MEQEQNIPMLISFYFGEAAVYAQRGASRRLKKWSRAFEMWMDGRRKDYQKDAVKQARMAWRRLARQCGKMPWEVTREDIEQHSAWMKQEGYAASTINCALGIIANFYEWCDKNRVDTTCEAGFNPAKEAARVKMRRYEGASLWKREEVEVFLDLLKRDESELGKRERAYFLARLYLGVPLKHLQQLRWEQIEVNEGEAWVRWREDGERVKLADPVWQAMREWLRASGRWEGMRAGKYIFAGLAEPGKEVTGGKAEDWLEYQPLSGTAMLASLKLYGGKVGIADEKLTMMALRRTAIRFRMDEGESLEGMKIFMDSREENKSTKYRLAKLPKAEDEGGKHQVKQGSEVEVPVRRAKPFKEGENITHGFYTRKKDRQAVREILAENLEGMKEEISCLRGLMRNLLEQEGDEVRLAEAYSQAAQRLGCLVAANKPAETTKGDSWSEQMLSVIDMFEVREGRPPASPEIRKKALGLTEEELAGKVTEEIGTIRLLLRNAYRRAMQGIETREYLRLIDLYGLGCVRLEKLLKISGGTSDDEKLERYLNRMIDEFLEDFAKKWEAGEWTGPNPLHPPSTRGDQDSPLPNQIIRDAESEQ